MSDILDDNEDYQEDTEQVEDNEVIDDEQDIEDGQDGEQDDDTEQDDSADNDVLDFSFDDDGDSDEKDPFAGQDAPQWVKDNRRRAKEVQRENRELKRKLEQYESSNAPEQQALREKPTFEAHEFDEDLYQADLDQWYVEKSQHDARQKAEQEKYQHYDERYKSSVDAVRAKVADYDEIEQSIVETVPPQRQALIKMLVDDPARMVVALGKSPAQLEKLLGLDDIQFAKQIVLMEQQMSSKTKSRNPNKPPPKTHELEGAAGGADVQLERLEAQADKTGDRSAVIAYKRKMRTK